eukprot:COSAG03_NODE_43_length_17034_cov_9.679953_2_plen_84_part_00
MIGIARPSGKWAGLLEAARLGSGTLTYPISEGSEGVDAMEATPELANWLASLYPDKQVCSSAPQYLAGGGGFAVADAGDAFTG